MSKAEVPRPLRSLHPALVPQHALRPLMSGIVTVIRRSLTTRHLLIAPKRWLLVLLPLLVVLTTQTIRAQAQTPGPTPVAIDNRRCLNCHGQPHIGELSPQERRSMLAGEATDADGQAPPQRPGLYVQAMLFTLHDDVRCTDCHTAATQLPHAVTLPPATCTTGSCHVEAQAAFDQGAHGQALAAGREDAPHCASCHGGHDMRPASDRRSILHPLRVTALCADCHREHGEPVAGTRNGREAVDQYLASVHGRALRESGLVVTATCVSCHGAHDVRPSEDPGSPVHRDHVAETCGHCHVGVEETFARSIHGQRLAEGHAGAPVCTDCHTAHGITRAGTPAFLRDIVNECGHCHNQPGPTGGLSLYDSYRRSYHGRVLTLGSDRAARCSDCHGAHDILPASDPQSWIHPDNRVAMCASCHENANANFAMFHAHADHRDRQNYPILWFVWLYFMVVIGSTFAFFGLHSVLWFIRSGINRLRHGPHPRPKANPHGIQRFNRVDRANHALLIISFFGLTLTGMPLFFADQRWAMILAGAVGGIHNAGILHRIFAIMLLLNVLIHVGGVINRVRHHGLRILWQGPTTMLPRWKDVQDCLGMFRWFFGGKKPRFDRWTYWEKFDYWAEIFGTTVIGGTGLLLWFPTFFSQWLPGWIFNVATIVHGYEALLAVGFIFTIHFFNAHLRWEKFPVDDVMFTGQLPEEEFQHERPMEYERLVTSGQMEQVRVAPAPSWQRPVAVTVGIVAMVIGTTMVALIVLAGLGVL